VKNRGASAAVGATLDKNIQKNLKVIAPPKRLPERSPIPQWRR